MKSTELTAVLEEMHAKREAGFNCAEGVFWGVCRLLALDAPVACMTGFGGGVAGSGSVCGALCGAIAAAGVYVGRTEAEDGERKEKCMTLSKAITQNFSAKMKRQLCREILGYLPGNRPPEAPPLSGFNPKCVQAVEVAVEAAVKVITEDKSQPLNQSALRPL